MSAPDNPGLARWLLGQVPTAVVLLGLAAIGVWGMTHDWKLPSTHQDAKDKEDWCTEHNVPEDVCVMCKPEVMPRPEPAGWCRTHGVHECVLCNPHLAQLDTPYSVSEAELARAKSRPRLRPATAERPQGPAAPAADSIPVARGV